MCAEKMMAFYYIETEKGSDSWGIVTFSLKENVSLFERQKGGRDNEWMLVSPLGYKIVEAI